MVAQPLRRADEIVSLWLCVDPLRLGGLRGKKSTPSVWLGGTGEFVVVGKQKRERNGAGVCGAQECHQAGGRPGTLI